jgi:hypothetical protein
MILLIVILVVVFGFGGGYWGRDNERLGWYGGGGIGIGTVLFILFILYLLGYLGHGRL